MPVLFGGHNLPPLVEIGLTDLPKSGGATPPGTTPLVLPDKYPPASPPTKATIGLQNRASYSEISQPKAFLMRISLKTPYNLIHISEVRK